MGLQVDKSDMLINITEDEFGDLYVPDSGVEVVTEDKEVQVEKSVPDSTKKPMPHNPKEEKKEGTIIVDDKFFEDEFEVDNTGFEKDDTEETVPSKKTTKQTGTKEVFDTDVLVALGKGLREEGFLPDIPEEELGEMKDAKDLIGVLGKQLQMVLGTREEELLNDMLGNLIKNGVVKKSEVVAELQNDSDIAVKDFNGDEDRMKEYLTAYWQRKGLTPKMIDKQIKGIVDLEEVLEEAIEDDNAYRAKRKEELALEYKKEKEMQKQRQLQHQQELEKNTLEVSEFIPGKKVNSVTKKKVLENIPSVIEKINTQNTKILPLLSYLDTLGVFDGKWDDLVKIGESKATDRLTEVLKSPRKVKDVDEDRIESLRQAAFNSIGLEYRR